MHIPNDVYRGSDYLDRFMSRTVKVELRVPETKAEGCFCCLASQVHIEILVAQAVGESISTRSNLNMKKSGI